MDAFFTPRSVALIGATATPGSVGRTILWNLLSSQFGGTVYPVNPKRRSVLGIQSFPDVGSVPEQVDLAVVVTPAPTVPQVIGQCIEAGVKAAIIISAGFKECGPEGVALERQIVKLVEQSDLRVIGPNCLGVINPISGLNATFAAGMALPGTVGFISQSGALCTSILDWSLKENVGFSAFISIGSMLDVGWGDMIQYLGDDPRTRSIVIYMETVGDARAFVSAAREVALRKPIIVIKAGRSEAAAKAAASHTGALSGSDEVLDAAFRRCGVLRVNRIADLFYMAEVLSKQPRPKGPRLVVVTNAGGPAVLATDALILSGGELAELSPQTVEALNGVLPPHWSHGNPIDILGDADAERYAKATEIAANDPNGDGLLAILTPQGMTSPTEVAERLRPFAKLQGKPMLASFMGGAQIAAAEQLLNQANIPTFPYPDTAARAFNYMWRYSSNLKSLYETPAYPVEAEQLDRETAGKIVDEVRKARRTLLTEAESKRFLASYGIPAVPTVVAGSEDDAVEHAAGIGYPVVLKLHSETITHKTDVGGVQLDLSDEASVRRAYRAIESSVNEKVGAGVFAGTVTVQPMIRLDGYELILGSSIDPQFGPVLLFGTGGQLVEVLKDRALALPPLNSTLARRMMEQTRIYTALLGVRGRQPVDLAALEQLVVRFSRLVVEQPWIAEIDINPLLASPEGFLALDARVVLHPPDTAEEALPHPAIRPYPLQYRSEWTLRDGTPVVIRPIRPEDEPLMVTFHEGLSAQSVYFRYFHMIDLERRIAHERLSRICFTDYDREIVLVAERRHGSTGAREIIGVGRLTKLHGAGQAEVAAVVADRFHNLGLGSELTRRVIEIARSEGLSKVIAEMLPDNLSMQKIFRHFGFKLQHAPEEGVVKAALTLAG